MNLGAFVTPYLKEVTRTLSTAILVSVSVPRCPDCVVTCRPVPCSDCICREGVRELAPLAPLTPSSLWSYFVVALVSFQCGIIVHYLWCQYFTVVGITVPKPRLPLVDFIDSRPTSPILLKIAEDKTDGTSTVSTDSDLHIAARSQVALFRKSRNGSAR